MVKRSAETDNTKHYSPDADLRDFLQKRLEVSRKMKKIRAGGGEYSEEIKSQNKGLGTTKVRILDKFVFPAMANLFYFFNEISKHPELQESFDDDIKDLLGVRRYNPKNDNYGFIFSNLIASILKIKLLGEHLESDDFRLRLIQILQNIIFLGIEQSLPDILKERRSYNRMLQDMEGSLGWTLMLAYHVKDEKALPHRVFPFIKLELPEE